MRGPLATPGGPGCPGLPAIPGRPSRPGSPFGPDRPSLPMRPASPRSPLSPAGPVGPMGPLEPWAPCPSVECPDEMTENHLVLLGVCVIGNAIDFDLPECPSCPVFRQRPADQARPVSLVPPIWRWLKSRYIHKLLRPEENNTKNKIEILVIDIISS